MQAGIVVYQRKGDQLVGRWSHEKTGGALADEIVHDVAAGALEGDWAVEIFDPLGKPYFTGRLNSSKLGGCVKLIWDGSFVDGGKSARFEGIGYASGADVLSATFEQITAKPA
jgi:hypothetical protein